MINGIELRTIKFNRILDDQLTIAVLSKGAISINDTNNMPISDRHRILNTLVKIENDKQEAIKNSMPRKK